MGQGRAKREVRKKGGKLNRKKLMQSLVLLLVHLLRKKKLKFLKFYDTVDLQEVAKILERRSLDPLLHNCSTFPKLGN